MPKEKGFDVKFFLGFLRGEKKVRLIFNFLKLLPIGKYGGFNFKYFSRSHNFTKMHLLKYFMESEELKRYIPDDISPINLTREYLLSVSILLLYIILLLIL